MTEETQIKDLPPVAAAELADMFLVQRSGLMKRISGQQLADLFIATISVGAPEALDAWLELVGQIEDNEDSLSALVSALATKADSAALALKQDIAGLSFGQCRLSLSGGNLVLSRFNGRLLTIDGAHEDIPSAGVSLAAAGLTPSTLYYIYAYMNVGTMTLEASTTAHAADPETGVKIKSGDATRTLVGMARPITGPAFEDSFAKRFVRSWFNRRALSLRGVFGGVRSTASLSWIEINPEIRVEFLIWADEAVDLGLHASTLVSASGVRMGTALTLDGVGISSAWVMETVFDGTGAYPVPLRRSESGLSEGYHFATLAGIVSSGTGSWRDGITAASRAAITGTIHTGGE
ncbi:hypothetical protein [Hoeflea sp. EC-HK425]|uniref:hypothetical protein n=1 Tax=Hoeflea sp. EC-HK425 TaxID=2038388 RepID=UPI001256BF9B|nr:hypothetical protein [Hoeflea sp. EC-HK425]MBV6650531.1 hypothetical protein [Hoeflea sp.]VVT15005.1 conserved hypothetical protein [Hoeflea sp. EC-HK425]